MSNSKKSDAFLTIRLPEELLEKIKQAAKKDRRPVSNWARVILEQAVEKQL